MWAHPAAAVALLALLIPIALHLFAARRANRIAFPTIRFIQPARLASIRRRAIDDKWLLLVRLLIVAAASAAAAGPFAVTAMRRRAWDERTVQRVVNDPRELPAAVASLRNEPPGRREIVVRSAFPIGSIDQRDVDAVPREIGLRFERSGAVTPTATVDAPPGLIGTRDAVSSIPRQLMLAGESTRVREQPARPGGSILVDVEAPRNGRASAAAVLDAVLRDGVPALAAGRRARVEFAMGDPPARLGSIREPWMGDAAAFVIRAARLRGTAPIPRVGSNDGRLIVATDMHPDDAGAIALVRSVFEALAAPVPAVETAAISDRQLQAWTRAPGPPALPTPDALGSGDSRWFWWLVLALMLLEWALRSKGRGDGAARTREDGVEARVA